MDGDGIAPCMSASILRILFRLLLCSAVTYLVWRKFGTVAFALSAPLFGVALARPIIELAGEFVLSAKQAALADLQGSHYAYHGFRLGISEDEHPYRWISVRDVRKVIPSLPRDTVLRAQFPQDLRHDPDLQGERIRAEALLAYLHKATEAESIRFRNWLEREVVFPAARMRGGLVAADEASLPGDRQIGPLDA